MNKKNKIRVAIGIQCRLASTRFPSKSVLSISETGMSALTSLLQNCRICADHVESKNDPNYEVIVDIWVLVPDKEMEFFKELLASKRVNILGGSPTNVLSRFTDLLPHGYKYIMRLTSDCPNVPQLAMNKAIWTAIYHDLDYCSNVWEKYRTAIDGHDIEVMSFNALRWLQENADLDRYKEHVTLAIRELNPKKLKKSCLIHKEDLSHIKLCIDTEDEYLAACQRFGSAHRKKKQAMEDGLYVYEY